MTSADELEELSRPRRLVTRELYPFNAFYGHADVLRAYAGIEGSEPLKAALEHGPTLFPDPGDPDLATWLPRYFCASGSRASFYAEHALHGAKPVAIGAPILYARALAPPDPPATRRLVYFDAHSSHYLLASYDVGVALARLDALRHEFEDVAVCLYWRDVLLGRAEPYLRRGFRCVTAGHMFDPSFLFRLVEIISSATVVLTDRLGTHMLYALALDRPVWLDFAPAEYELAADAPHGPMVAHEGELVERATALFAGREEAIDAEQRAFAEEFAGIGCFRSPADLAAVIAEAEAAYCAETPARVRLRLRAKAVARRLWNLRPW